jgi:hypothetical protein|tara:strand:+ start:988 stop:1533 length:546 start_codon:yes stop_codon:yes gene_type:complete
MVKYYFEVVELLGESGNGIGAGYINRHEFSDLSSTGINKKGVIKQLKKGIKNGWNKPSNNDICYMEFKGDNVICRREWCYDDGDMNDDNGMSLAKVTLSDIERVIDDLLDSGASRKILDSVNSFHAESRYSEGAHEQISDANYRGQVELWLAIEGDKVGYTFLPSLKSEPKIRLTKGKDYL